MRNARQMGRKRTVTCMSEQGFVPVTSDEVIAEITMLIGSAPVSDCSDCLGIDEQVRAILASGTTPDGTLADLAALFSAATHFDDPLFYPQATSYSDEGPHCDFDLELARDTAILGQAGVPLIMAWGPPHRTGETHPDDWHDCPSCTEWVADRARARSMLTAAGIDATAALGPHDDPF